MNLWMHQIKAIGEAVNHIRKGRKRICIAAPTGAGKTVIAAELAKLARKNGVKTFFAAPKVVLVEQTAASWAARTGLPLEDFGILQANNTRNLDAPYIIGTPQTVASRGLPDDVRLVIIDECHKRYTQLHDSISELPEPPTVIGLTATPYREAMAADYDELVLSVTTDALTIDESTPDGVLCPIKVFAAKPIDTTGLDVNYRTGDYGTAEEIEQRTSLVLDDAVARWEIKCAEHFGRTVPTLVFSRSIRQGEIIVESFNAHGHRFAQVHSGDDQSIRAKRIKAFRNGELDGLVSVDVLAEGFDVPAVQCIVFARPTRSLTRLIQSIGRGQRMCEGKEYCLVLDMSEAMRYKFNQLQEHWGIGPRGFTPEKLTDDGIAPAKICPECGAIVPLATTVCPECGYEFVPKPKPPLEGELVELRRCEYMSMSLEEAIEEFAMQVAAKGKGFAWRCAAHIGTQKAAMRGGDPYNIANGVWYSLEKNGALRPLNGDYRHQKAIPKMKPKPVEVALIEALSSKMDDVWREQNRHQLVLRDPPSVQDSPF